MAKSLYKTCEELYENAHGNGGQAAVLDYIEANHPEVKWAICEPCECLSRNKKYQKSIWTYKKASDGSTLVMAGYDWKNGIGYFITKNPWKNKGQYWTVIDPVA